MRYFLLQRLVSALVVLVSVITLVYFIFFSLPVDPVELLCDRYCTPELVEELKRNLDLDGSILSQLFTFFAGLFIGREMYAGTTAAFFCEAPCLGYSFRNGISVSELIWDRMPATISLAFGALFIAVFVGFSLALIAVSNLNSRIDRFVQSTAMFFTAVQVYIAGLVLQYLVVFRWGWLPMPGYQPISEGLINWVQGLILPWITLGLALAGSFARIFRTKLVELIPADFVRTGRALGQSKSQLIRYNLIRPSLGPVLALFGLVLGELLGGTVLTELVFNISGVGKLTADAITYLDLPLLVGVLIVSTFFVVLGNLIADLLHYLTDPRIALRD